MISDAIQTSGSILLLGSVTLAQINAALQCVTVGAIATYWVIKTCRYACRRRRGVGRRPTVAAKRPDGDPDEAP